MIDQVIKTMKANQIQTRSTRTKYLSNQLQCRKFRSYIQSQLGRSQLLIMIFTISTRSRFLPPTLLI